MLFLLLLLFLLMMLGLELLLRGRHLSTAAPLEE